MKVRIYYKIYRNAEKRFFDELSKSTEIQYYKLKKLISYSSLLRIFETMRQLEQKNGIKIFSFQLGMSPQGHICKIIRVHAEIKIQKYKYNDFVEIVPLEA